MSQTELLSQDYRLPDSSPMVQVMPKKQQKNIVSLAAAITKNASTQTYYTIQYLVDRPLVEDAYRAYAYFRWVDDYLDDTLRTKEARLAFLHRQQEIVSHCYAYDRPANLSAEEALVADLIAQDSTAHSGLHCYITQMMQVMAIDVERKGRYISLEMLDQYTHCLATAVTEAMHYFIGHGCDSPQDRTRYFAVTGAHITHMLRDAIEDTAMGYYNIPREYLETHHIGPADIADEAYIAWVEGRVKLARHYFAQGRDCLKRVENLRCRMAGYAYIARFEVVLDAIEKDGFLLRLTYPERKGARAMLKMGMAATTQTIHSSIRMNRFVKNS